MLALVWLVATPSWAKDCQIGPITVDAPSCDVRRHCAKQLAQPRDIVSPANIDEQPVMADAMKTAWQDVKHEAADEFVSRQRHDLLLGGTFSAVILVAEGHAALVVGEEPCDNGLDKGERVRLGNYRASGFVLRPEGNIVGIFGHDAAVSVPASCLPIVSLVHLGNMPRSRIARSTRRTDIEMAVPHGENSKRLLQVQPDLALQVLDAHLTAMRAELIEASAQAHKELAGETGNETEASTNNQ